MRGSLCSCLVTLTLGCSSAAVGTSRNAAPDGFMLAAPATDELRRDPVMRAMLGELRRSAEHLVLDGNQAPYYLAYVIKEVHHRSVVGALGAIYDRAAGRQRNAYVEVRVGDYGFDSSEDGEEGWTPDELYEPSTLVSLDDGELAIRHTLWLLTDTRYKMALASYLKMKGERVYAPPDPGRRPSFSASGPEERVEARVDLTMDTERWEGLVRRLGRIIGAAPGVFDSDVAIDFRVETRWMVNSEGVRVRTEHPIYAVHVTAYARADDGMLLDHSVDEYARSEADLPTDDALAQQTQRMLDELAALRAAPQSDPYTGPAILDTAATGVFFHEVLGHRLEGHRQDDDEEGRTFTQHLGQQILPAFLSVHDDPTLDRAPDGQWLNGSYAVDDEGVRSERVTLVDHGKLVGFLMPRRPVKGFDRSNGHGRAQGVARPVARMGNVIVQAHETVPFARLKERLLEMVREQGKPYGLIIRDITGGATNTSSYGYQAFKGEARLVYRVDPATGDETLVRGVEIVGTPLASIAKIVAASDDVGVFNGYCGAESGMVPVSAMAPATLFSEIELQRSAQARSKGPVLEPPAHPGPARRVAR